MQPTFPQKLATEEYHRCLEQLTILPEQVRTAIAEITPARLGLSYRVGSSRVDLQACKLEYSIVSPK